MDSRWEVGNPQVDASSIDAFHKKIPFTAHICCLHYLDMGYNHSFPVGCSLLCQYLSFDFSLFTQCSRDFHHEQYFKPESVQKRSLWSVSLEMTRCIWFLFILLNAANVTLVQVTEAYASAEEPSDDCLCPMNTLVIAPYDDEVYRAVFVRHVDADNLEVFFLDFGNTSVVPKKVSNT